MSETTANGGEFPETQWTLVTRVRAKRPDVRRKALEDICAAYWPPVYAYARRQGCSPEDAEDFTQGFFAQLLDRRDLWEVREAKGKLRTFFIVSMKHYLANAWKRERRLKRGGGTVTVSLDAPHAEQFYCLAVSEELAPDDAYDRAWALVLLDRVMERLRKQYEKKGKAELFEGLRPHLTRGTGDSSYAEAGTALGLSEGAVKVAVHRLRQRYGVILREEIAETLTPDEDVEEELRHLFELFS